MLKQGTTSNELVNPEVRTRVGLDSESESNEENIANNGDHEDHGNGHNDGQNDAGLSHSAFEVIYSAEKNDGVLFI